MTPPRLSRNSDIAGVLVLEYLNSTLKLRNIMNASIGLQSVSANIQHTKTFSAKEILCKRCNKIILRRIGVFSMSPQAVKRTIIIVMEAAMKLCDHEGRYTFIRSKQQSRKRMSKCNNKNEFIVSNGKFELIKYSEIGRDVEIVTSSVLSGVLLKR